MNKFVKGLALAGVATAMSQGAVAALWRCNYFRNELGVCRVYG